MFAIPILFSLFIIKIKLTSDASIIQFSALVCNPSEKAFKIFVGGTWGKTQRMGTLLSGVYTEEEIPTVIEKVMLWYKENGYVKERLGATVDRLGTDALEAALATNDLLDRKDEILAKPLLER